MIFITPKPSLNRSIIKLEQQEKLADIRTQLNQSESDLATATQSYEAAQHALQAHREQLQGLQREQHSQQTQYWYPGD